MELVTNLLMRAMMKLPQKISLCCAMHGMCFAQRDYSPRHVRVVPPPCIAGGFYLQCIVLNGHAAQALHVRVVSVLPMHCWEGYSMMCRQWL